MKIMDSIITAVSALRHPDKRETIHYAKSLKGLLGIEIGGPSAFFRHRSYFPVYLFARAIDGVNFDSNTVWEGEIKEGNTYHYLPGKRSGRQYISEAVTLNGIPDNCYDFLLSCHSLEHVANPIKALKRWYEVLKPGGMLVLVVPNKTITFDINRPYTTMEHLVKDYHNHADENDTTHFREIFELHHIEADPGISSLDELQKRTLDNFNNRCVHHHVFSLELVKQLLEYCNFTVSLQKEIHTLHLFTIAVKPAS